MREVVCVCLVSSCEFIRSLVARVEVGVAGHVKLHAPCLIRAPTSLFWVIETCSAGTENDRGGKKGREGEEPPKIG